MMKYQLSDNIGNTIWNKVLKTLIEYSFPWTCINDILVHFEHSNGRLICTENICLTILTWNIFSLAIIYP